jgi:hypothetical protein
MSIAKKGDKNPMYNKPVPPETRAKLSEKMKAYWQTIPSINDVNH